jgi:hypothetical protein
VFIFIGRLFPMLSLIRTQAHDLRAMRAAISFADVTATTRIDRKCDYAAPLNATQPKERGC